MAHVRAIVSTPPGLGGRVDMLVAMEILRHRDWDFCADFGLLINKVFPNLHGPASHGCPCFPVSIVASLSKTKYSCEGWAEVCSLSWGRQVIALWSCKEQTANYLRVCVHRLRAPFASLTLVTVPGWASTTHCKCLHPHPRSLQILPSLGQRNWASWVILI